MKIRLENIYRIQLEVLNLYLKMLNDHAYKNI